MRSDCEMGLSCHNFECIPKAWYYTFLVMDLFPLENYPIRYKCLSCGIIKTEEGRVKESDFLKIKISDAIDPPEKNGFYQVYSNRYWAVTEDDCILFFKGRSPQCNSSKSIIEHSLKKGLYPATKIMMLKTVFVEHDCSDFL